MFVLPRALPPLVCVPFSVVKGRIFLREVPFFPFLKFPWVPVSWPASVCSGSSLHLWTSYRFPFRFPLRKSRNLLHAPCPRQFCPLFFKVFFFSNRTLLLGFSPFFFQRSPPGKMISPLWYSLRKFVFSPSFQYGLSFPGCLLLKHLQSSAAISPSALSSFGAHFLSLNHPLKPP